MEKRSLGQNDARYQNKYRYICAFGCGNISVKDIIEASFARHND
jgi:hypothetical protein